MDVFAWCEQDMTGVPRILREVKYQNRVANPVLVKKPDGSWRMCIDFKDINKACPKDNYLLPEIDWKLESLNEYPFKCFMEAYRGYHQLPRVEEDEDNTAFHSGKGIYCYIKMSFGLKNVGATYQRLIASTFESQIGLNIEAFGEKEGKFFGYYVAEQGIKANPKKIAAIENMTTPKTIKEVQSLTGSEVNYENFVYALLLTSKRLRRYFQGHPIHVLTDLSVKQVLNKPKISGRLVKWAIELWSYEITYLPQTSVKGQVLADYLAEMTCELKVIHERIELKPVKGETWDLFINGASCIEGAGAGLVLTSPSGEEHTYTLRFNFDVTNNEAEYEALITGLNIGYKMKITKLRAYIDSLLVSSQYNGSFDTHELSMQKYLKLLKESTEKFEHFELAQVSRSQNKKADALSKLPALNFSHFQKQVWVEEFPNKAIDG
ncbi:uncharacterized protein [Rutidosis leptorrhynchoides]|uniref:uncharacterized protein n=1 Tax=Rutidosis leptorrhynchoides TaxID=125765 RepID=UPI003A98DE01